MQLVASWTQRTLVLSALGVAAGLLIAPAGGAQVLKGWAYGILPYAWLAGTDAQLGFGNSGGGSTAGGQGSTSLADVTVDFGQSAGDILSDLNFAAMGTFDAHNRWWRIRLDGMYSSLTSKDAVAIAGATGELEASPRSLILQPTVSYRIGGRPWGALDVLAGARYWHAKIKLSRSGGILPAASRSQSRSWWDGIGGLRLRVDPPRSLWHAEVHGDIGGGGSDITWQTFAGVTYDVSHCCSVGGGYRVLDVSFVKPDFVFDGRLHGPALGFLYKF